MHPGSIAESTRLAYAMRYRSLHKRYSQRLGYLVDADELVTLMLADRPTLAMRTWRYYKASVLHVLSESPDRNADAIELLASSTSKGLPVRSSRGSGRKAKGIPTKVADELVFNLQLRRRTKRRERKYSTDAVNVLIATVATGLRPSEWTGADLAMVDGVLHLVVANGKHNIQRGNGASRSLILSACTEEQIEVIHNTIMQFKSNAHQVVAYIKSLNREIKTSLSDLAEDRRIEHRYRHISLYSARHQFAADAKSANLQYREVAALLGHRSQKTAAWHYAKKSVGSGAVSVSPTSESVAAVGTKPPRSGRYVLGHKPSP